jgi:hypothetical protein
MPRLLSGIIIPLHLAHTTAALEFLDMLIALIAIAVRELSRAGARTKEMGICRRILLLGTPHWLSRTTCRTVHSPFMFNYSGTLS